MVNKNKVFIFVIEMVIISSTKVIKKVINKRTKLTFLEYGKENEADY